MRKWLIAGVLALALAGIAIAYARLSEARSQETSELLARVPGAQSISIKQMTGEPPVFPRASPRIWTFSLDSRQAKALQSLCDTNRKVFPNSGMELSNGCVASYYFDSAKYRYVNLAIKGNTATLTSMEMSKSDFDEMLKGYNTTLPPPHNGMRR